MISYLIFCEKLIVHPSSICFQNLGFYFRVPGIFFTKGAVTLKRLPDTVLGNIHSFN